MNPSCFAKQRYIKCPSYLFPSQINVLLFIPGSMLQPDFSILDRTHSPFPTHSTFPTHSPFSTHSPTRQRTLADSLDCLDTSPSRFSLPSPAKSSDEFSAEEAELRALVDEADRKFPLNLSYGMYLTSEELPQNMSDAMLWTNIGSEFHLMVCT